MKYSWIKALPYLIGFGTALVAAALNYTNTFHVSTTTGIATVMAAKLAGNAIQQYLLKEQASHPIPAETGTATLVAQEYHPPVVINIHPGASASISAPTDPLHSTDGENATNAHNA